jgi:quercetin dioxygenase-like cupin family protein
VEFSTSEGDPHWCELGHIGYVLQGGLEIDFNGTVLAFAAGDGLFIPPGASSAHRGVSIIPGTRLFMVEEQSECAAWRVGSSGAPSARPLPTIVK